MARINQILLDKLNQVTAVGFCQEKKKNHSSELRQVYIVREVNPFWAGRMLLNKRSVCITPSIRLVRARQE